MIHKLKITLKQHTPIIHFQHNQKGATLRATEVKPKLDKYIIKHMFNDNFDVCYKFLIGYNTTNNELEKTSDIKLLKEKFDNHGYRALNYKMRILLVKPNEKLVLEGSNLSMYFGNTGTDEELEKKGVFYKSGVIIEITSIVADICDYIISSIDDFFFLTNFGNRQSKSYGSYSVVNIEPCCQNKEYYTEVIKEFRSATNRKPYKEKVELVDNFQEIVYPPKAKKTVSNILNSKNKKSNIKNIRLQSLSHIYETSIFNTNYNDLKQNVTNGDYKIEINRINSWKEYNKKLNDMIKAEKIERAPSPLLLKIVDSNLFIIKQTDIIDSYNNCSILNTNE